MNQTTVPQNTPPKTAVESYFRLLRYVKPYIWAFVVSIFGYVIYAASTTAFAELMKYLVDSIEQQNPDFRWLFPTLMVASFAARGFGSFLGIYFMEVVARGVVHKLR